MYKPNLQKREKKSYTLPRNPLITNKTHCFELIPRFWHNVDSTQTFKNIHLASGSAELAHQGEKPIDFTVLILPPFQLSSNEGKIFFKTLWKNALENISNLASSIQRIQKISYTTLKMFAGVYKVFVGFPCNIYGKGL